MRVKQVGGKGKGKLSPNRGKASSLEDQIDAQTAATGNSHNKILQQDLASVLYVSSKTHSKPSSEQDVRISSTGMSPAHHNSRINPDSQELPRSSKSNIKDRNGAISGGKGKYPGMGGGKHTPTLSARKQPLKKTRRFRPGMLALKEIKKL